MLSRFSHILLFAMLWTQAHQAPLSMGFSSREYWSVLPCPPPENLPDLGTEPTSLMFPALAGRLFITNINWEAQISYMNLYIPSLLPLPPTHPSSHHRAHLLILGYCFFFRSLFQDPFFDQFNPWL